MDPIVAIGLVAILGVAGVLLLKPRLRPWSEPTPAREQPASVAATPAGGVKITPDLGSVKPGDAISLWDGTDTVVRGSLDCREELGGRTSEWRWVFLSGDRVLELLPHGQVYYEGGGVAHQGDDFYVDVETKLRRFEGNVREGIPNEPVEIDIDGQLFRVRATGTFSATRVGELPESAEVWADVSQDSGQNVYFKMVPSDATDEQSVGLGIWTTHMLIMRGRKLDRSEITGIYGAGA